MSTDRTSPPRAILVVAALAGIAVAVLGLIVATKAAGWITVHALRAMGMLSPEAYSGTPLVLEPVLWLLAALYSLPALLFASTVSMTRITDRRRRMSGRRLVDLVVAVAAVVISYGVMNFAFDPTRSGGHEPLVSRYEELPYEGADLVLAATWVMLGVALALTVASRRVTSPDRRLAVGAIVLAVLTPVFGALFA